MGDFRAAGIHDRSLGSDGDSLDALRKANTTSYYKGNGSLWVKLVSSGDDPSQRSWRGPSGGVSLQASR